MPYLFGTIILIATLGGLYWLANDLHLDLSPPKPVVPINDANYTHSVYKTTDKFLVLSFLPNATAVKDTYDTKTQKMVQTKYRYKSWNDSTGDDIDVLLGKITLKNFVQEIPQGLRDQNGVIYFKADAPEQQTIEIMRELGSKANQYYSEHKRYPDGEALAELAKIAYKNPFGSENVVAHEIAWPADLEKGNMFSSSKFESGLENGNGWTGETPKPGEISAASATAERKTSIFLIHAWDRDGNFLRRADGKVFLLVLKNGKDVSPTAELSGTPSDQMPALRVATVVPDIPSVFKSYLPIGVFLVLSMAFALTWLKRSMEHDYGSSPVPFGCGWAVSLLCLSLASKLAVPPISEYATTGVSAWFVLGLVILAVLMGRKPDDPMKI